MAKALPVYAVNPQGALTENAPLILHTRLEEMYRFAPYIADPARMDELHNMRIAAKRLRYTLEIFAPCFGGKAAAKEFRWVSEQVKSVQEQIGDIHDADVRGPLFRDFVAAHAAHRPEIRVGLETLARAEQDKRAGLYQQFLAFWSRLQEQGFKPRFLQMLAGTHPQPTRTTEETPDEQ